MERENYIDVAKGICILLVVCIHSEVFGVIGMPFMFIAVPMFFFMSGFFDRSERPITDLIKKSAKTLLFPGLIWIIIGCIYQQLLHMADDGHLSFEFDIYKPTNGNGPVWFLVALFYAKILTAILVRIKTHIYVQLSLSLIIGFIGYIIDIPLLFDEGMIAFPLYFIGKLIYPRIKSLINNSYIIGIGTICLLLFIFSLLSFIIVPGGQMSFRPYYIVAIICILFVFFPVLSISNLLCKWSILYKTGRRSLGIMLVHAPICHTITVVLNRLFEHGSLIWIVLSLIEYSIVCILSYYLTVLIEKKCPIILGMK